MSEADIDPIWGPEGPPAPRPRLVRSDTRPSAPLVLRPARLPDPTQIPPRQWLYGTQLIRGFVTILVAPGGTGKSAYAMAIGLALATGTKLLGEHVFAQANVAVLNLEDPLEELERRLAALMIRYRVDETDVAGRYFLHSGEDRPLTMAAIGDDGFTVVHPDEEALVAEIKAHNIGVIIVDPHAESHALEENSNPQMNKAAAAWRRVARATGCAILLVHHVRKGAVTDIDASRGAKALTDSARVGLLMSPMSPEEGEQLGIPSEDRWQYVRLDNAKANMAPKAGRARWFQLDQVELHNGTQDYPHGDRVAAIIPWEPPSVWAQTTTQQINAILDIIGAGPRPGILFSATKRGASNGRWAGQVVMDEIGVNETQAKQVITQWLQNGLLVETDYRDATEGKTRKGVVVVDAKRPS